MKKQKDTRSHHTVKAAVPGPHTETAKDFYRKVIMLQEEERQRISRDLHDETGQMVIALGASLNIIEKYLRDNDTDKAMSVINENRKLIQEIASKMKSMALNLRPPALDILGLSAVLREFFSQCTKLNPIKIEFKENMKDTKLDDNMEITVYRIVQEAMHNIQKYAIADHVKVNLITEDGKLTLCIEDNGKGFNIKDLKNIHETTKMGLRGIKERVDILEGTFKIDTAPGKGTILTVVLPI